MPLPSNSADSDCRIGGRKLGADNPRHDFSRRQLVLVAGVGGEGLDPYSFVGCCIHPQNPTTTASAIRIKLLRYWASMTAITTAPKQTKNTNTTGAYLLTSFTGQSLSLAVHLLLPAKLVCLAL